MQTKQKFFFMVIGAVLGVTILLIGMVVSPTTAQKDTFGEITCTGLTVLGQDGKKRVRLRDFLGGAVEVWGKDGRSKADMRVGKYGGLVSAYGNDGKGRSAMGVNQYGNGAVTTWDKYGDKSGDLIRMAVSPTAAQRDTLREITCTGLTVVNPDGTTGIRLMIGKHGGLIGVYGKDEKSTAGMGIDEHGGKSFAGKSLNSAAGMDINELDGASFAGVLMGTTEFGGDVTVKGIDGKRKAAMGILGHGAGAVEVRDKDGTRKAIMYINQYGTGDVGTFDKNGYRQ